MSKTSSIYTRVEPEIKEQAEQILATLGIPVSSAINLFLHQVVIHKGIPFDVKIPTKRPLFLDELTPEQLDAELQKGLDDIAAGRVIPIEDVWNKLQQK